MPPSMPRLKRRQSVWRRRTSIAPTMLLLQNRSPDSRGTESVVDVSSYLEWPFFPSEHGGLARRVDAWATAYFAIRKSAVVLDSVAHACRQFVSELRRAGWTRYSVPSAERGPIAERGPS